MQERIQKVLEGLERMREQAKRNVGDGKPFYYVMHSDCALEFAELAIELFAELQHELPQFGEGFKARLPLYTAKRAEMLFNEGWFNSIAIGYGKIALESMGIALLGRFEDEMKKAFDLYEADHAEKIYQRVEGR